MTYPKDNVCTPFTGGQGDGVVYTIRATMEVTYYDTPGRDYSHNVIEQSATFNMWGPVQSIDAGVIDAPYNQNFLNKVFKIKSRGLYNHGNQYYPIQPLNIYDYGVGEEHKAYPVTVRFLRATVTRGDGQPDTSGNPPPLPWEQWSQEKQEQALELLNQPDFEDETKSMPPGVPLNPGDNVNDEQIIIPGQPNDDPNTPEDESKTRVVPGPLTIPGTPPSPPPPPSIFPSPQPLPTASPSPEPSPSPAPSPSPSTQPPTASSEPPSPSPDPAPTPSEGDSSSSSPDS